MATVLTSVGKAIATGRQLSTPPAAGQPGATAPRYIQWGTGAGTAAVGDVTCFTAAAEARVLGTDSQVTTTVTNDTYQVVGTITSATGQTITNAATFDAAGTGSPATGGNIAVHGDFAGIALNSGDSIQFTIKTQLT
jgi:hypothetical protein